MSKLILGNNTTHNKEQLGKQDLAKLLDYYRHRVELVEKERVEFLAKIEAIKIDVEEKHKLEWELKKRTEEISELQDNQRKISLGLGEERKQIYALVKELESVKCNI